MAQELEGEGTTNNGTETLINRPHVTLPSKVTLLFETLSQCPKLAAHVRRLGMTLLAPFTLGSPPQLELREFPRWMTESREFYALQGEVNLAISNCVNLETCVWTRDATLRTEVLEAFRDCCPKLRDFEFNGNSGRYYDVSVLRSLSGLERISVIMPDKAVVNALWHWIPANRETLRTLSFTCQVRLSF